MCNVHIRAHNGGTTAAQLRGNSGGYPRDNGNPPRQIQERIGIDESHGISLMCIFNLKQILNASREQAAYAKRLIKLSLTMLCSTFHSFALLMVCRPRHAHAVRAVDAVAFAHIGLADAVMLLRVRAVHTTQSVRCSLLRSFHGVPL